MRWQGMKVHVVAVSMLVALAAFLGAQWLYTSLNFQQPLIKELDNNKLVTDYQIEEETDAYKIVVTLGDTGDLMDAYRQINDGVQVIMGERPFVIELVDRRNDRLSDVYNQGQFAIHEAMAKGNFRDMADSLNQYASNTGVDSKVSMDSDNIYWLMKDSAYYLYAVIPRNSANVQERGASGA